jgi:hypothetical protein
MLSKISLEFFSWESKYFLKKNFVISTDFSDAVFNLRMIARISILCNFHFSSKGTPSLIILSFVKYDLSVGSTETKN